MAGIPYDIQTQKLVPTKKKKTHEKFTLMGGNFKMLLEKSECSIHKSSKSEGSVPMWII